MNEIAAKLIKVNHRWPSSGVTACRDVSLTLQTGSLHALVGENGAGKTTLGLILSGILRPDSGILFPGTGEIILNERKDGLIPGIGLIRQRSIWPPALTVREAAILGRKKKPPTIKAQLSEFNRTAEKWELKGINPQSPVSTMDAAALQRAEMIAALMFNPGILILDEPSSAWEEGRSREFFHLMSQLRDRGKTVLLITHRLEDVFKLADQVTVMRHGKVNGTWNIKETDYQELTRQMFGDRITPEKHSRSFPRNFSGTAIEPRVVVQGINVTVSGRKVLTDLNFFLYPGEILGITGLREEGLTYLEEFISGNLKADQGYMTLNSMILPRGTPGMRKAGVHYVPSDKTGRGASLNSTVTENLIVLETQKLTKKGWFLKHKVNNRIEELRSKGGIFGEPDQKLKELSGGNIQKIILQRELNEDSQFLVIADPTWGLDEQSRWKIHQRIRKLRDRGVSILLLASELDEALELSDRMGILSGGKLSELKSVENWNRNEAAEMIAGIRTGKAAE